MRKVVFGGANSLDNYFARKDDAVDWLWWSDEVGKIMADYFKTFDTIRNGPTDLRGCYRQRSRGRLIWRYENLCLFAHAEAAYHQEA